jgi:hypothetical protein
MKDDYDINPLDYDEHEHDDPARFIGWLVVGALAGSFGFGVALMWAMERFL